ncbi:LLM class flavin-dependent oxidoreductase [Nocardia arthritidis]|uniref:LLM class flavin-dependent oxidoreductase n=1 Tax=Nocardia arthritidis TaxID=228602 RepID=A0A6G9Y9G3_9NOCA|nr:LLM class flavin-dependent oxidoreductase [Nocardia arthritidis]QIS09862.1 LLM class flavin-dependent oxidoreductase [Nocardia arthritidis]
MRYGIVILPDGSWSQSGKRWRLAEEFGFDHAWTFDHLTWRWLQGLPWHSAVPTLAAAAASTTRIRLGTMVASPNLRNPVTFAKEMMTLDDISAGRAICGIGAGAEGHDSKVFGSYPLSRSDRARRFHEFVELTDLLLRNERTSYDGDFYQARDAHMYPGCVQRPRTPLAIAAAGSRGMRLVARAADAWITTGVPGRFEPNRFDRAIGPLRDQLANLAEGCAAEGRNFDSLDKIVVAGVQLGGVLASKAAFLDARGLFAELGFTDMVVFWPRQTFPFEGQVSVLDDIAPLLLHRGLDAVGAKR